MICSVGLVPELHRELDGAVIEYPIANPSYLDYRAKQSRHEEEHVLNQRVHVVKGRDTVSGRQLKDGVMEVQPRLQELRMQIAGAHVSIEVASNSKLPLPPELNG